MNTQFYNDKLDKKGIYLWCLPEHQKGRRFVQPHKIGMTTRPFVVRNKGYSGIQKSTEWTANYLLPLNVDDEKLKEMEKYVKKKLFEYAQAHPMDIFPKSKDWRGEYYDVDCRESDNFKQVVFDLFQQIQNEMIQEREDLINKYEKEIKDLKKLIVQDCKNKNIAILSDDEQIDEWNESALPYGWITKEYMRKSGTNVGSMYYTYISPEGTRFRSIKKALEYIELTSESVPVLDEEEVKVEDEVKIEGEAKINNTDVESSSMVARLWKYAYTG